MHCFFPSLCLYLIFLSSSVVGMLQEIEVKDSKQVCKLSDRASPLFFVFPCSFFGARYLFLHGKYWERSIEKEHFPEKHREHLSRLRRFLLSLSFCKHIPKPLHIYKNGGGESSVHLFLSLFFTSPFSLPISSSKYGLPSRPQSLSTPFLYVDLRMFASESFEDGTESDKLSAYVCVHVCVCLSSVLITHY